MEGKFIVFYFTFHFLYKCFVVPYLIAFFPHPPPNSLSPFLASSTKSKTHVSLCQKFQFPFLVSTLIVMFTPSSASPKFQVHCALPTGHEVILQPGGMHELAHVKWSNDTCWLFTQMQGTDSDFVLWDTNPELSYFRTKLQFVDWGCVSQPRLGIRRCAQWNALIPARGRAGTRVLVCSTHSGAVGC